MLNGWVETKTYIDDGYSGGNFQRPGFLEMMEDARKGVINLILVKDLSRLGRDFVEVGRYTDSVFPSMGVRFVSVLDCLDSDGDNDMLHFRSLMNDYDLRDLSNKIKAVFHSKQASGQCLISTAPFGYQRSADDRHRLVIDEPAASAVRQMYEWRRNGMSYNKITTELNRAEIPSPRVNRCLLAGKEDCSFPQLWTIRTVKLILQNEVYIGNFVMNKFGTRSYKDRTLVQKPESEWVRIKGSHEAIVSPELWREVQEMNAAAARRFDPKRNPSAKLFTGKIFCADCGSAMSCRVNRRHIGQPNEIEYPSYFCSKYWNSGRSTCSWHTIGELTLKDLILAEIRSHADMIASDRDGVTEQLKRKLLQTDTQSLGDTRREILHIQRRVRELENLASRLYEDRVNGKISAESFGTLVRQNEQERLEKTAKLQKLTTDVEEAEQRFSDIEKWAALLRKYRDLQTLGRETIDELIDRIEIGESSVQDGKRCQDIKVFYRFVGQID